MKTDGSIETLLEIMRRLRDPQHGCPWDLQQDFASITTHTLEEVYEVIDAIERRDYADLKDELGDLLFQIVFYAQLAGEQGEFVFADLVEAIAEKLVRRHPHVFAGDATQRSAAAETDLGRSWERIKAQERRRKARQKRLPDTVLGDIPRALPALIRAQKLQHRAACAGFDWDSVAGVLDKLREELQEVESALEQRDPVGVEEELGDLLFSCVNLVRKAGLNAERTLRRANSKFQARFAEMAALALQQGHSLEDLSAQQLDNLWEQVKRRKKIP